MERSRTIDILFLQTLYQKPIAYVPEYDIYGIIGDETDGMIPIYPIEKNRQILFLSPAEFLKIETAENALAILPENFRQNQAFFRQESDESQGKVRTQVRHESETIRQESGESQEKIRGSWTKSQKRIIDYYRLDDFSRLYSGHLEEITAHIFRLTIKALGNTSKRKTIDKILQLYERAKKNAQKGGAREMHSLRIIRQELETLIGQQERANENRERAERKRKLKKQVYMLLGAVVLAVILAIPIYHLTFQTTENGRKALSQQEMSHRMSVGKSVRQLAGYYLIVGSYRDSATAMDIASQYPGAMILQGQGLYRIAIARYSTLAEARKAYFTMKTKIPDIWILKK